MNEIKLYALNLAYSKWHKSRWHFWLRSFPL